MNKKMKLALKVYAIVDVILAIIAVVLYKTKATLVEANWTEENLKWIVGSIGVIILIDLIFYAVIGFYVSRKADNLK